MKVLNIIGHPSNKSFNYAIYDTVNDFCFRNRAEVKNIDLYKDNFDPVVRDNESEENKSLVEKYKEMINWSDVIVITSPVWWFRCTTMIEGFFDKVFVPGFAYKFKSITKKYGYPVPLLKNKKVITFLTHGAPALPVKTIYVNSVKLRILLGVYSFCFGWFKQSIYQFWSVPFIEHNERMAYLDKVKRVMLKVYQKVK